MTVEDIKQVDRYGDEATGDYRTGPEVGRVVVGSINGGEREVGYADVDGLAVFEGDIVLGTVDEVRGRAGLEGSAAPGPRSAGPMAWCRTRFFPAGAPISVTSRGAGNLDLFVTGNDGRVYTSWWQG